MCDANTDFMTHFWYEDYPFPFPDFNINRKCGDFDAIGQWAEDHSTDLNAINSIPKPDEQEAVPMSRELRRILSQNDGL